MTQQYTHRNGETEPPTVEGWYWFHGKHVGWAKTTIFPNRGSMQYVSAGANNTILTTYIKRGRVGSCRMPVQDLVGRWWGPIVPPWRE